MKNKFLGIFLILFIMCGLSIFAENTIVEPYVITDSDTKQIKLIVGEKKAYSFTDLGIPSTANIQDRDILGDKCFAVEVADNCLIIRGKTSGIVSKQINFVYGNQIPFKKGSVSILVTVVEPDYTVCTGAIGDFREIIDSNNINIIESSDPINFIINKDDYLFCSKIAGYYTVTYEANNQKFYKYFKVIDDITPVVIKKIGDPILSNDFNDITDNEGNNVSGSVLEKTFPEGLFYCNLYNSVGLWTGYIGVKISNPNYSMGYYIEKHLVTIKIEKNDLPDEDIKLNYSILKNNISNINNAKSIGLGLYSYNNLGKFNNVTWSSSDPSVLSFDENGIPTAHKVGYTTIICTNNLHPTSKAECLCFVTPYVSIAEGEETSSQYDDEGTYHEYANMTNLISENPNIVEITEEKKIKGILEGITRISFKDVNIPNKTFYTTVNVYKVRTVGLNKNVQFTKEDFLKIPSMNGSYFPKEYDISSVEGATYTGNINIDTGKIGKKEVVLIIKDKNNASHDLRFNYAFEVVVPVDVTDLIIDKNSAIINVGKTIQLNPTIKPSNATDKKVIWTTNDKGVATVDENGIVTGLSKGTAIITAKTADGGFTKTCKITVVTPVEGIKLDKNSLEITNGKSVQLTATVSPSDAYNKSITWSSSNSSVATVDSNGLVKAISKGIAIITVKTVDGEYTATCKIIVDPVYPTSISINKSSISIDPGETYQLTISVFPNDAVYKDVIWSSSNTNVATVSANGLLRGNSYGKAIITASLSNGIKGTCVVSVNSIKVTKITLNKTALTLNKGKTFKLIANMLPANAANKKVTWSSSNSSIATIGSTGIITAVKSGTATMTCLASDGSGIKATCKVTVPEMVSNISLNKTTISLNKGKTFKLIATISPTNAANKKVTWTSSNSNIANVSSTGIIKAIKAGTVTVTCIANDGSGVKATCKVTVCEPVTNVVLNKNELSLNKTKTFKLIATILPDNASNKKVKWVSSDTSIATVSSTGVVTALNAGVVVITCTAIDGSCAEDTCIVTVKGATIQMSLNKTTLTLNTGKTFKLITTITNAISKKVVWSSSNINIATVGTTGIVKGISPGTVTITATLVENTSYKVSCKVTIK